MPSRNLAPAALLSALALPAAAARAADPAPAINVSEICTTCKDVIRCTRATAAALPAGHPVVVYYLHQKTTWEQIVTIWEYLIRFGGAKQEDTRVLTVYEFTDPGGEPSTVRDGLTATLNAASMDIRTPDARIDRTTGGWSVAAAPGATSLQPAGSCALLPPTEGFAFLRSVAAPD